MTDKPLNQEGLTVREAIGVIATILCVVNSFLWAIHKLSMNEFVSSMIIYFISAPVAIWGLWKLDNEPQKVLDDKLGE